MVRTFSQQVARVYEIVGYVILGPATMAAVFALTAVFILPIAGEFYGALAAAAALVFYGFGVKLLRRCYQHSRGMLIKEKVFRLWLGVLIFYLLLFLPNALLVYGYLRTSEVDYNFFFLVWMLLTGWLEAAVILPFAAIYADYKNP